jgi:transcriptional regulator with XRE-family HTH domain
LAAKAGVSAGMVSYLERGRLEATSLATLRKVAATLEIRIDVIARWRGGDLERLLSARHSLLAGAVIATLNDLGWQTAPEVSFSVYGERGFIDLLAWHAPTRTLLVIELKTEIVDAGELLGILDRKTRLAAGIARQRGWSPRSVGTWLVIADSSTNRARVKVVEALLRAALPADGRQIKAWLRTPTGHIAALSFFQNLNPSSAKQEVASRKRVRRAQPRSMVAQR